MNGFGTEPTTIENVSLVRTGGHFWGSQTFPGNWLFSASKVFQGIRTNNADIVDPMYSGIMFQTNDVGGQPQFPIKDTVLSDISITGAKKSGDAFDATSGFGLWANEMPEAGQGRPGRRRGHDPRPHHERQPPEREERHQHVLNRHQPVADRPPRTAPGPRPLGEHGPGRALRSSRTSR